MSDPQFAETLEQTLAALSGNGEGNLANVLNPMGGANNPDSIIDAGKYFILYY